MLNAAARASAHVTPMHVHTHIFLFFSFALLLLFAFGCPVDDRKILLHSLLLVLNVNFILSTPALRRLFPSTVLFLVVSPSFFCLSLLLPPYVPFFLRWVPRV